MIDSHDNPVGVMCQAYIIMKEHKVKKLPVVTAEGELQGMYVWNDVKDDASKSSKFSLDNEGHFLVGAAIGNNPLSPNNPTL